MNFRSLLILLLVYFNFIVVSCDKERPLDYRTQYCGEYRFESFYYSCIQTVCSYSDTIIFDGLIQVDQTNDSTIIIIYAPDKSGGATCSGIKVFGSQIDPVIDEEGSLVYEKVTELCGSHGGFNGRFLTNDSIYFHAWSGSLGEDWGQYVMGNRIQE